MGPVPMTWAPKSLQWACKGSLTAVFGNIPPCGRILPYGGIPAYVGMTYGGIPAYGCFPNMGVFPPYRGITPDTGTPNGIWGGEGSPMESNGPVGIPWASLGDPELHTNTM
jgi:hypothetical protein